MWWYYRYIIEGIIGSVDTIDYVGDAVRSLFNGL